MERKVSDVYSTMTIAKFAEEEPSGQCGSCPFCETEYADGEPVATYCTLFDDEIKCNWSCTISYRLPECKQFSGFIISGIKMRKTKENQ